MAIEAAIINDLCLANCLTKQQAEKAVYELLEFLLELNRLETEVFLVVPYYDMAFGYLHSPLYQLLFETPGSLDIAPEIVRQLMVMLGKCSIIEFDPSTAVRVQDAAGVIPCDSYAYAASHLHSTKDQKYFGILRRIGSGRVGVAEISCNSRTSACFILSSSRDLIPFFRRTIEMIKPVGAAFLDAATKAYPNLQFHPDVAVENLQMDLNLHMPIVVRHLAFLNDELRLIGDQCAWDVYRMQRTALVKGVNFSDESANTKKDAAKMKRRNVNFGTNKKPNIVCCSFHTKILPNEGRIHFFPSNDSYPGKVLIGLFHNHLPI